MEMKEETIREIGFQRLAILRPGINAGNAHTLHYLARLECLIPGPFCTIEQDDIGCALAAEFASTPAPNGVVVLENGDGGSRALNHPAMI
jgi:hypothetical protein